MTTIALFSIYDLIYPQSEYTTPDNRYESIDPYSIKSLPYLRHIKEAIIATINPHNIKENRVNRGTATLYSVPFLPHPLFLPISNRLGFDRGLHLTFPNTKTIAQISFISISEHLNVSPTYMLMEISMGTIHN